MFWVAGVERCWKLFDFFSKDPYDFVAKLPLFHSTYRIRSLSQVLKRLKFGSFLVQKSSKISKFRTSPVPKYLTNADAWPLFDLSQLEMKQKAKMDNESIEYINLQCICHLPVMIWISSTGLSCRNQHQEFRICAERWRCEVWNRSEKVRGSLSSLPISAEDTLEYLWQTEVSEGTSKRSDFQGTSLLTSEGKFPT